MYARMLRWAILLLGSGFLSFASGQGPVVNAPAGPVRGVVRNLEGGGTSTNFLGIPFAEPPVGNRRFELPVRMAAWTDVKDASEYGDSCVQDKDAARGQLDDWTYDNFMAPLRYSEDCLTLNVFVPGNISAERKENLPVMFYFYGGGFLNGHSAFRIYEGDWLATSGDVIVVSANYRLGILGFFTTGTDRLRGNAALYDQNLALQWVRDNIGSFGGDPSKVTIFGQSAGGASVTYHDVSPLSRGLYSRVIIMSGSSQDLGGRPEEYREQTEELTAELGCSRSTDEEALSCLKQLPADAFIDYWITYAYQPCIDGTFVPDILANLYGSGQFSQVPHFIGTTSGEGTIPFGALDPEYLDQGLSGFEVDLFLTTLVTLLGYDNFDQVYEAIANFYFPDGDYSDYLRNVKRATDAVADFAFESPKGIVADSLTKYGVESYMYYFEQRAAYRRQYAINYGAHHSDDLPFVFGGINKGIFRDNGTEAEKEFSRSTMNAWTSFARGGAPAFIDTQGNLVDIPRYTDEGRAYADFKVGMDSGSIKANLKKEAIIFWNEVLPSIGFRTKGKSNNV